MTMARRSSSLRHALGIAFAMTVSSVPVLADAPAGQYLAFTKDTPTIQDDKTKLEWQRGAPRTLKTFAQADSQCDAFGAGGRIPTIKELFTIFDEEPHTVYDFGRNVTKQIDQSAFGSSTAIDAPYWSSTPATTAGNVWAFSFADGTMVELPRSSGQAYARCVR
jgi:hypothetical protein